MNHQTQTVIAAIKNYVHGICWGFPKQDGIMVDRIGQPFKLKSLVINYQRSKDPNDNIIKVWNVAIARTVEPDEVFKTHSGWMLHILLEHAWTHARLAAYEHNEIGRTIIAYKAIGKIDGRIITSEKLESHEGANLKK